MYKVIKIKLRSILNSHGEYAIESDIYIENGFGRASAPAAIVAGRRESSITKNIKEKIYDFDQQVQILVGMQYSQQSWDDNLSSRREEWGSDLILALSLAFARAVCQYEKQELIHYIRGLGITLPAKNNFMPMIPIFSGGVHDSALGGSMQQIMFSVSCGDFSETINTILALYNPMESMLMNSGRLKGYSASSGFLTDRLDLDDKFYMMADMIERIGVSKEVSIAVDVAAEHLYEKGIYNFHHKRILPDEMEKILLDLTRKYPLTYIEDPFDAVDRKNWNSLYQQVHPKVKIFSDDLSATQVKYLDDSVVHGVIIKLKQVGTLTGALQMVNAVRKRGLLTCVSHRSYETMDTFMCDLGVAIKTDYIKIGGPRRGDRVEKYNRLIRIFEKY